MVRVGPYYPRAPEGRNSVVRDEGSTKAECEQEECCAEHRREEFAGGECRKHLAVGDAVELVHLYHKPHIACGGTAGLRHTQTAEPLRIQVSSMRTDLEFDMGTIPKRRSTTSQQEWIAVAPPLRHRSSTPAKSTSGIDSHGTRRSSAIA